MSRKPIAIIGSIDSKRTDFDPPLKDISETQNASRALGKALAEAEHPILVFSSSTDFLEYTQDDSGSGNNQLGAAGANAGNGLAAGEIALAEQPIQLANLGDSGM